MRPIITSRDVASPEGRSVSHAGQPEGAGLRRPVVQRGLPQAGGIKSGDKRDAPPLDAVAIRNEIASRLMRLHCARVDGCTRRCRRVGRCVEADAVAAETTARLPAGRTEAGGAKKRST